LKVVLVSTTSTRKASRTSFSPDSGATFHT
jgi:hypothetical protein